MKRVLLLHLVIASLATLGCQTDANLNGGRSSGADGGGVGDGALTADGSSHDLGANDGNDVSHLDFGLPGDPGGIILPQPRRFWRRRRWPARSRRR